MLSVSATPAVRKVGARRLHAQAPRASTRQIGRSSSIRPLEMPSMVSRQGGRRRKTECSAMLLPVAGALAAAGVVEGVAATMLILNPEPFVMKLYGAEKLDPLTKKYCRAFGVALLGYTVLAFLAVATRSAHWTVIAAFAFYNVGATVNNAVSAGVGNAATVLHALLSVWLLWCLYLVCRTKGALQ